MKKLILLCTAISMLTFGAYAQCAGGDGINTAKKWTPPSTTSNPDLQWNNANSWTPAGVPDCDDDVTISDARGRCILTTSVSVRKLNILRVGTSVGTLRFEAACSLTCRDLVVNDGVISINTGVSSNRNTIICDTLIVSNNGSITANFLTVRGKLTMNAGYVGIRSRGIADLKHVELNAYAQFSAPSGWAVDNRSRCDVRGNFYLHQNASYIHNEGLLRFIDTGRNLINTAGAAGNVERQFWNVEINKKLDGAGDISQPGRLYTPWGTNEKWVILNKLHLKEACLESWNTSEYLKIRDSLVIDASMSNNATNYGFGFNGLPGAQGGVYLIFDGDKNGRIVSNGRMTGMYNLKIDKTTATKTVTVSGLRQEIGSITNYIDVNQGILAFDGSRSGSINANGTPSGFIVRANGRLLAPDDDSLFFNGCWNMNNTKSYNAQNSTLVFAGNGNKLSFTNNGDTIFFRNVVVRTAATAPNTPVSLTWTSTSDCLGILGDLVVDDTADAYFSNPQLHIYGNLVSNQTQTNTLNRFPEVVLFTGTNNQSVKLSSAAKSAYGKYVIINKTAGAVTLNSLMEARDINFTSGLLNTTSSNILVISRPDFIRGGNSNSYINGPVRVMNGGSSSLWNAGANTYGKVPVGGGGNYRPIGFFEAGNNQFEVTYTASNTKSGDNLSAPIDEVSTTDLWRVDHLSGSSTNYKILFYLTGKPASWNNTEVRIATQADGSAPWYNQGGTYYSSDNVIHSTSINISNSYMLFTHGRDVPAPMMLVKEGVSGREVATVKAASNEVAPAPANKAVQFNVYPNPVQENLFFQIQNADKGVVTLSDMSGKMLGMYNAAELKSIDMSKLTPGMYLVSFTDGLNRFTHRVVKNQ